MIVELRKITPFINFGFNRVTKVAYIDEVVDVYLRTVYNRDVYKDFNLVALGASSNTKINDYHYQLTYNSTGVKEIKMQIEKGNPLEVNSVPIELTIESNSFDSDTVGFDNTELTFDIF